jgi:hypothetical protein
MTCYAKRFLLYDFSSTEYESTLLPMRFLKGFDTNLGD